VPNAWLRVLHDAALLLWAAALFFTQARLLLARRRGIERELALRRRVGAALAVEHVALAVAVAAGLWSMAAHGWRLGYPRWLSIKLGLVVFLLVPLEGMHAWVNHVWLARALTVPAAAGAPLSRDLDRGLGMDDMVRTLAALLLAVALPVIVWLSLARPG
jgi:uncharacterized membrane protein